MAGTLNRIKEFKEQALKKIVTINFLISIYSGYTDGKYIAVVDTTQIQNFLEDNWLCS